MFAPRYFAFAYFAARYFPPVGALIVELLPICLLNMVTRMGALSMAAHTGAITVTAETGDINMLTRCR